MNETSTISVQVDNYDKILANDILKNMGMNMSTYVNMSLKQLTSKNKIPFEVVNPESIPNLELDEALNELDEIEAKIKDGTVKTYSNTKDMLESIINA